MLKRFQPSLQRLNQLVDWFIPADLAADRETHKQARMFLFSHLFGPFIGNVVPAAVFVLDPKPTYDVAVLAVSITAFWAFPFILRTFGRYNLLVLLSVQNLIFCILWSCYFYGGVSSPTVPWVLTIPLLAFFYIGPHSQLRLTVLGLFVVNVIAFAVVYWLDPLGGKHLPTASLQGLGIVSTSCTALYVTMMAIYYAKILASGVELENEMKHHLATAEQLRRATAEAERAGAAKAEFLAKMSHELRTPLNAVIGYSQILLEDAEADGDDQSVPDLQRIHAAGHYLLKLINEILDLSKIEAGRMELFIETANIAELVTKAVESCRTLAESNGNELLLRLAPELGTFACDASKVEQVIVQLLDNAAKFTKNGRVSVTVKRRSGAAGEELTIAIRDTGIGIAPEMMPRLFEQFTVVEDSSSTKYGGTGLGLALSERLCWLMGGEITPESTLGVGSCFTIHLPVEQSAEAAAHRRPSGRSTVIDATNANPVSNAA